MGFHVLGNLLNKHGPAPTVPGNECALRARCLWGKCEYLHCTDRPAIRLGDDLRLKALRGGSACLESYSQLAMNHTLNWPYDV